MTNLKSKIAKAGLGLLAGAVMFAGVTASAMTQAQAQALVASLGITGASATALVTALTTTGGTTTTTTGSGFTFTKNLSLGSKGADVTELQKVLNSDSDTTVALSGVGSKGNEGTNFGPATKAAVMKFQKKHNITPASGNVFALTRAALNAMGGTTTTTTTGGTTTTGTQTGPVTAMLSSDTPAAGNVILGQATADLAHFTFSGNGTVTAVTLKETGISVSTDLTNVYLYDGVTRVGDAATVNSNGVITFSGLNLMVSGSKTISVKADYSANGTTATIGVNLTGFTANGSTNTVNLSGNLMYVVSAPSNMTAAQLCSGGCGSVTGATNNQIASSAVDAGSMSKTIWQAPLQVSGRIGFLKAATFRYIGSASYDALANIKLVIDGQVVGTPSTVNSSGYIVFDLSSAPFSLSTNSHSVEVRADIVKGSARSFQISLQNASDLMITDSQLNINVAPTTNSITTFSTSQAGTVSVNAGSISISIDPTFSSMTNVTGGATNTVVGKYKLRAYGEDMKVSTLSITPTLTSMSPTVNGLNNVTLFFNGSQIGSSYSCDSGTNTSTDDCGSAHSFTLGSSMIVPAGVDSFLEVHADVQTLANVAYTAGTIKTSGTIAIGNAQGLSSLQTNSGAFTLSQTTGLSVQTGQLVVAKNTAYTNQTFAPNASGLKIGSFILQNQSSSEAIRVTNLALALTATSGSVLTSTAGAGPELADLTNVKTSETSGSGANPQNAAAALNYSVDFTIAPGTSKTIDIFADLGSTNSVGFEVQLTPTAYGAGSNVTLTPSSATVGQVVTIANGTVSAPSFVASNSTAAQYIATAGTSATDITKAEYQFTATNGTANINNLRFAVKALSVGAISTIHVGSVTSNVVTPSTTTVGTGGWTTTATTVSVASTSSIPAGTILTVDSEDMLVSTVVDGTNFTVVRGVNGTSAALHTATTVVNPSGLATLNGVNISVPNGTSGTYVDAYESFTPANGMTGAIASKATSTAYLTYVKSTIGSTVSDQATATPVAANQMTTVGSKPIVTVANGGMSGLILSGSGKIGEVTVAADTAGSIKVNQLVFTVGSSNITTPAYTAIYLADGSSAITTSDCIISGSTITCELAADQVNNTSDVSTLSASAVHTDGNGYLIPGSGSKTFSLYATVGGTAVSGTTPTVTTSITSAGFNWDDVAGNGTNLNGTNLYNFPTNSYSYHS
ncbi:MAG: peptidoglycan-binding domain-containing protein [bacterium]